RTERRSSSMATRVSRVRPRGELAPERCGVYVAADQRGRKGGRHDVDQTRVRRDQDGRGGEVVQRGGGDTAAGRDRGGERLGGSEPARYANCTRCHPDRSFSFTIAPQHSFLADAPALDGPPRGA